MEHPPRRHESRVKVEASAGPATPMEQFKSLASRLLGVPRKELQTQERRYKKRRSALKRNGE